MGPVVTVVEWSVFLSVMSVNCEPELNRPRCCQGHCGLGGQGTCTGWGLDPSSRRDNLGGSYQCMLTLSTVDILTLVHQELQRCNLWPPVYCHPVFIIFIMFCIPVSHCQLFVNRAILPLNTTKHCNLLFHFIIIIFSTFTALTLLVGHQEEHPTCKKIQ